MKVFCKKLLSVLLCLILLCPVIMTNAYTTDEVTEAASNLIISLEGNYSSVNPDDVGAVSLGKVSWHATRALNLLKTIINANPENAKSILSESLYNEILNSSNWDTRTLNSSEQAEITALLSTEESISAQDNLAYNDVRSYVVHGKSLGITDAKALVFFADLENHLGAVGAERVADSAIASVNRAENVTLDVIYNAAMSDSVAKNNATRRKTVYDYCKTLTFGEVSDAVEYKTGEYKITLSVSSYLTFRSGPSKSYSKITSIPNGTLVTVTEVSGDWGKITYNGTTGWICLLYAKAVEPNKTTATSSDVKGDVDLNGKVEASDARLILRYSAKLEEFSALQKNNGDVNNDGKITASDARTVLRVSAKLETL